MERLEIINLLLEFDCTENLSDMSTSELLIHLHEHQFDALHGEWPEDP